MNRSRGKGSRMRGELYSPPGVVGCIEFGCDANTDNYEQGVRGLYLWELDTAFLLY